MVVYSMAIAYILAQLQVSWSELKMPSNVYLGLLVFSHRDSGVLIPHMRN